jgi:hypothetical protein
VSAISCRKLDVASNWAAWRAPSISCGVTVGMAGAGEADDAVGATCAVAAHDGDRNIGEIGC